MTIKKLQALVMALAAMLPPLSLAAQDFDPIAARITDAKLHGHIQFLADDLLEGRGPATNGDRLAQLYIETQFRTLGLQPVKSLQGYRQPFPMLGLTSTSDKSWSVKKKSSP